MNQFVGWAFYLGLVAAGLAAIAWTTSLAHRYGLERLQLGHAALSVWTVAAFLGLFVGLWLPSVVFLGTRSLVRFATARRETTTPSPE